MDNQDSVIYEELSMLNILLEDNNESKSSEESQCSQKRKASDDLNDTSCKQRKKDKSVKSNRKRRKKKYKSSACDPNERKMILRPNYFVGIQVSNPEIHQVVKMVQEVILSKEPALRTALLSIPTLHITLAAAHLRDIEHVNRAAEMVEKCVSDHKEFFSKSTSLHFSGLHTFGDKVLFAGIQQGDVLEEVALMAKDLEVSFQELTGFATKKGFKPHLTILKLSKDIRLRKKGISKISSNLYSDISNTVFGTQTVKGIQLLSMNKPKDENGYYFCSHQVTFDVSCSESNDHTECCKKPLSVKPELKNVSDLTKSLKEDKNIIKRRFHSLSMAGLSSVFGSADEPPVQRDSLLKTLLIIGAATGAIIAIVRGMSSNK